MASKKNLLDYLEKPTLEHCVFLLLLVICIITVRFQVFAHPFMSDEQHIIESNEKIRELSNIPSFFTTSWKLSRLYRPLPQTSFAIDYFFWGMRPYGYRITSLIWHLFLSWTIFVALRQLQFSRTVYWSVPLLFALHPMHRFILNSATGRSDTMCAVFCLWSWIFYKSFIIADSCSMRSRVKPGMTNRVKPGMTNRVKPGMTNRVKPGMTYTKSLVFLIFSIISFFLACLCKEIAVALLFVFIMDQLFFYQDTSIGAKIRLLLLYLSTLIGYFIIRTYVLGGFEESHSAFTGLSFLTRIRIMCLAFVVYLRICLFPTNLGMDYQLNDFPILDSFSLLLSWIGIVGVLLYIGLFCYFTVKNKYIAFALGWFFVFLLPVSNIIPTAIVMGERFLVLPILSVLTAFALIIDRLNKRKDVVVALILCCYGGLNVYNDHFWQSEEIYYQRILSLSPNSYLAHMKLGKIHFSQATERDTPQIRKLQRSLEHFKKAVDKRCYPQHAAFAPLNCGRIYAMPHIKNEFQAIRYLQIAVDRIEQWEQIEKNLNIYLQLGNLYFSNKNWAKAQYCLQKYVDYSALQTQYKKLAYERLAVCYMYLQNFPAAIRAYRQLIKEFPKYNAGYYKLGLILLRQKDYNSAREYLKKAYDLGFQIPENHKKIIEKQLREK